MSNLRNREGEEESETEENEDGEDLMADENHKKRCRHQLRRTDDVTFQCIEDGEHSTHRHGDLFWRTGETGRWRITATDIDPEYVGYGDEEV